MVKKSVQSKKLLVRVTLDGGTWKRVPTLPTGFVSLAGSFLLPGSYIMNIWVIVSLVISIYALVSIKRKKEPRSFYVEATLNHKTSIGFYVLYVSGSRLFFQEKTDNGLNISSHISIFSETNLGHQIVCESHGNVLSIQHLSSINEHEALQGERLDIGMLSLTLKYQNLIEGHLDEMGWNIDDSLSGDLRFSKDNIQVYVSYLAH